MVHHGVHSLLPVSAASDANCMDHAARCICSHAGLAVRPCVVVRCFHCPTKPLHAISFLQGKEHLRPFFLRCSQLPENVASASFLLPICFILDNSHFSTVSRRAEQSNGAVRRHVVWMDVRTHQEECRLHTCPEHEERAAREGTRGAG